MFDETGGYCRFGRISLAWVTPGQLQIARKSVVQVIKWFSMKLHGSPWWNLCHACLKTTMKLLPFCKSFQWFSTYHPRYHSVIEGGTWKSSGNWGFNRNIWTSSINSVFSIGVLDYRRVYIPNSSDCCIQSLGLRAAHGFSKPTSQHNQNLEPWNPVNNSWGAKPVFLQSWTIGLPFPFLGDLGWLDHVQKTILYTWRWRWREREREREKEIYIYIYTYIYIYIYHICTYA